MKILIIILFILSLMSCGTGPPHRHREGDNSGQETSLTIQDEVRMTKEILPNLKKQYPPVKDRWLQSYVRRVGNRLIKANNLNGNPYYYNFTVVDVKYVNAFALPAGTIFTTAPLISMASSEAELTGVIGHVMARHAAESEFIKWMKWPEIQILKEMIFLIRYPLDANLLTKET